MLLKASLNDLKSFTETISLYKALGPNINITFLNDMIKLQIISPPQDALCVVKLYSKDLVEYQCSIINETIAISSLGLYRILKSMNEFNTLNISMNSMESIEFEGINKINRIKMSVLLSDPSNHEIEMPDMEFDRICRFNPFPLSIIRNLPRTGHVKIQSDNEHVYFGIKGENGISINHKLKSNNIQQQNDIGVIGGYYPVKYIELLQCLRHLNLTEMHFKKDYPIVFKIKVGQLIKVLYVISHTVIDDDDDDDDNKFHNTFLPEPEEIIIPEKLEEPKEPKEETIPLPVGDDIVADDDTSELDQCQICMENVKNTVNVPCGHSLFCIKCANDHVNVQNKEECLICNTKLNQIMNVYK